MFNMLHLLFKNIKRVSFWNSNPIRTLGMVGVTGLEPAAP